MIFRLSENPLIPCFRPVCVHWLGSWLPWSNINITFCFLLLLLPFLDFFLLDPLIHFRLCATKSQVESAIESPPVDTLEQRLPSFLPPLPPPLYCCAHSFRFTSIVLLLPAIHSRRSWSISLHNIFFARRPFNAYTNTHTHIQVQQHTFVAALSPFLFRVAFITRHCHEQINTQTYGGWNDQNKEMFPLFIIKVNVFTFVDCLRFPAIRNLSSCNRTLSSHPRSESFATLSLLPFEFTAISQSLLFLWLSSFQCYVVRLSATVPQPLI